MRMKVRWREHELIFVTILVAAGVLAPQIETYTRSNIQLDAYGAPFKQNGYFFIYWKNALLPKISIVILFYLGYLSINKIIIPLIKKISFTDFEKLLLLRPLY